MIDFYKSYMLYNLPFHILSAIAVGLMITGFFVDPLGMIDPTVLYGTAEIFGFAALWTVLKAIDKGGVAKLRHGKTSLEVKNEKRPEESLIQSQPEE